MSDSGYYNHHGLSCMHNGSGSLYMVKAMQAWFLNIPCKQTCDSFTYSSAIHSFFTKSSECEDCSENTWEDRIRLRSFTEEMILKWTSTTPWRFKGAWGVGVPRKSRQGPCYRLDESLEVNETKQTQCVAGSGWGLKKWLQGIMPAKATKDFTLKGKEM